MKYSNLFHTCVFLCVLSTSAYDIGCIYPSSLLGDNVILTRQNLAAQIKPLNIESGDLEDMTQPIVSRIGVYLNGCTALCLAFHDPDVLDPFTMAPTFVTVPPFGQNAYSITMCMSQCWIYVWEDYYDALAEMRAYFNDLGLDVKDPSDREDIESALTLFYYSGQSTPIMEILEEDDYHPFTMGHIAGLNIRFYSATDGFNAKGALTYSTTTKLPTPCTGNCRKFQDITGYTPVPDPRKFPSISTDSNKYNCTGLCTRYQPEQNMGSDKGTIRLNQFPLPHIGLTAKTYLRDVTLTLQNPQYDYYQESLAVVERLRETATDQYKKEMVSFFRGDNGFGLHTLRGPLQGFILQELGNFVAYQDDVLFWFGMSLIENDGLIQVWREKRFHDLVRPKTVIKQWDDDELYTYGGNPFTDKAVNILARDFEPLYEPIESTPEFPSATSCFCEALMEFIDLYLLDKYGQTITNITVADNDFDGGFAHFDDMEDFRDTCRSSLLWGGHHYPASVTAGEEVCSGLGALAVEYLKTLSNGSNYNGGWYRNETVPLCPDQLK